MSFPRIAAERQARSHHLSAIHTCGRRDLNPQGLSQVGSALTVTERSRYPRSGPWLVARVIANLRLNERTHRTTGVKSPGHRAPSRDRLSPSRDRRSRSRPRDGCKGHSQSPPERTNSPNNRTSRCPRSQPCPGCKGHSQSPPERTNSPNNRRQVPRHRAPSRDRLSPSQDRRSRSRPRDGCKGHSQSPPERTNSPNNRTSRCPRSQPCPGCKGHSQSPNEPTHRTTGVKPRRGIGAHDRGRRRPGTTTGRASADAPPRNDGLAHNIAAAITANSPFLNLFAGRWGAGRRPPV